MATGIDALGQSLLSQKDSINRQNKREYEKAARNEQKMAVFNGLLRFADGAIQDRHNKFFENEESRTVARLIKDQEKMLTQRQDYENNLDTSNKTKEAYELDLVESELNDDDLGNYIEGWADFTKQRKRQLLYGSGKAYNPETDNVATAGLYKAIAHKRLAARDAWGIQLKDLDPIDAKQQWREVNPYSKNLLSGALGVLKKTFLGNPATNSAAIRSELFNEIKADSDQYARFREIRAAGFSIDGAIEKLNNEIVLTEKDRRGQLQESKVVIPTGRLVEETTAVRAPSGELIPRTSKRWVQEPPYLLNIWKNSNGDITSVKAPITSESINTETGKPFTAKEVKASENSKTIYQPTKDVVTQETDYYTGAQLDVSSTYFFKNNGEYDFAITKFVNPTDAAIAKNPTIGRLADGVVEDAYNDFNLQVNKIASLGDLNPQGSEAEDVLKQFAAFTGSTDSERFKDIKTNYGGSIAVIASKIGDITKDQLGFNQSDTNLIAMQLMFIDKFSEERLRGSKGKKQLNGLSATTTEVDISKLILAIDLLRANGSFAAFKDNTSINDNSLFDRITNSGVLEAQESLAGNPQITDGERFYSPEEVKVIKQIKTKITELDSGSTSSRSLLNIMLEEKEEEDKVNFNSSYSVFDLMVGDKFETDPLTGKLRLPPPPKPRPDAVDIKKQEEAELNQFNQPRGIGVALDNIVTPAVEVTKAAGSLLSEASSKVTDVTSMMQANSMVYDSEGKNLADLPRPVLEKVLAAGPPSDKWKTRIERALAEQKVSPQKDSLLSNPKTMDLKLPDEDSTVEDKIEFFAEILGDKPNEVEFMKEVVWQESKNGTVAGTYELDSKGKGSYGVAQVDRSGFNQIQGKITDPKSKYFEVAESLKEVSGIDLSTVKYEDLNDDLLSVIYGRLYLAQITDEPIPNTVEERAKYWKKYYNTSAGKGTVKGYLTNMEERKQ